MICHIVLFKIKDEYKDQLPELAKIFAPMLGKVEGLLRVEAGPDILHSERSTIWRW